MKKEGFEGEIEKIEKINDRYKDGVIVQIFVPKPLTMIKEMTNDEQREYIKDFGKLHLGKCELKQDD